MVSSEVSKNLDVALVMSKGLLRDGLDSILSASNYNLIAIEDDLSLLEEKYETIKPDVLIVDCDNATSNEQCLYRLVTGRKARVAIICRKMEDKTFITDIKMGISCLCFKESADTLLDELELISQGETIISKGILSSIESDDKERGVSLENLTRREAEVLCYVGKGYSNKGIAEKLYLSENTIKGHVHSILAKLSLKNRQEITAYAVKRGIDTST